MEQLQQSSGYSHNTWIHPEARRKAIRRAKYRANAGRWDLNAALVLFGVIIAVFILGITHVSFWINLLVIVSGFGLVLLLGKRKARKLLPAILEDELASASGDWKDYYRSLDIHPSAGIEEITTAYHRITRVYEEVLTEATRSIPLYSIMYRDAKEAWWVLADPVAKAEYDRLYWQKCNDEMTDIDLPSRDEIVDLSQNISREVIAHKDRLRWRLPGLTSLQRKIAVSVVAVLLAVGVTGVSLAFAAPENALAAPFRGAAVTVMQIASGTVELIENVRAVGSSAERQVVSTMLQLMRVQEKIAVLDPVTVPTNDMASFPSTDHSLFPDYLDRRYSQFEYTVDEHGIVTVHTGNSTTGPMIEKIIEMIREAE